MDTKTAGIVSLSLPKTSYRRTGWSPAMTMTASPSREPEPVAGGGTSSSISSLFRLLLLDGFC